MTKWRIPPLIKIYEALGAIVDDRILVSGNSAKVYSSSGNKYYDVTYDASKKAIMTNDNGSFWKGYLGYPAIAYLIKTGTLPYEVDLANLLKNIMWKDLNQKFKNDFDKTLEYILEPISEDNRNKLNIFANNVLLEIEKLNLSMLGKKVKPPEGY